MQKVHRLVGHLTGKLKIISISVLYNGRLGFLTLCCLTETFYLVSHTNICCSMFRPDSCTDRHTGQSETITFTLWSELRTYGKDTNHQKSQTHLLLAKAQDTAAIAEKVLCILINIRLSSAGLYVCLKTFLASLHAFCNCHQSSLLWAAEQSKIAIEHSLCEQGL